MQISRDRWRILIAIGIVLLIAGAIFGVLFMSRDALAEYAWQRHTPFLALEFVHHNSSLAMQLGNFYFGGGAYNLVNAEVAYRKAVENDQGILWSHYQLARIFFVEGRQGDALTEINKELQFNPENLRSLYVRGLIYGALHNPAAAEANFERFVAWEPTEWAGYNDLSWTLLQEKKHKEAAAAAEKGMRMVPSGDKNPWLWNNLGVAYLNLHKDTSAAHAFEKAQLLANALTISDWRKAYPGNDPSTDESTLSVFRHNISANLEHAKLNALVENSPVHISP